MIREMEAKDISRIIEIGEEMHSTTSYQNTDWNPLKVAALCVDLIHEGHKQAWVAVVDGAIVGMFFGVITDYYFGDTLKSIDLLLYVTPEARGGSHAVKLVNAYIKWALEFGVRRDQIKVGVTTGVCDEQVGRLYTKLGFEQCGQLYSLR